MKPRLSYLSRGVVVTLLSVAIVLSPSKAFSQTREQPQYEVVIVNGHIIDDTGNPWYAADLAISGDRIAAIGDLHDAHAKRVIDAKGRVVAPGFIRRDRSIVSANEAVSHSVCVQVRSSKSWSAWTADMHNLSFPQQK